VRQSRIDIERLQRADEIFITNAIIGIRSIESIARIHWRPREPSAANALRLRLERL
jgi:branched-subunit amino acid aminotransferase/4-amino-4-deoxychorismate lyase